MINYRKSFISLFLKTLIIISCFLWIECLPGCSLEQKYPPFRDEINSAIDLLEKEEYLNAIDTLKELVISLNEEDQNDYVKELKADAEYVLGNVYEACKEFDFA